VTGVTGAQFNVNNGVGGTYNDGGGTLGGTGTYTVPVTGWYEFSLNGSIDTPGAAITNFITLNFTGQSSVNTNISQNGDGTWRIYAFWGPMFLTVGAVVSPTYTRPTAGQVNSNNGNIFYIGALVR
jgi:hypothetical protein